VVGRGDDIKNWLRIQICRRRSKNSRDEDEEWRIHFHVLFFLENYGTLSSTQLAIKTLYSIKFSKTILKNTKSPGSRNLHWEVLPERHQIEFGANRISSRNWEWVIENCPGLRSSRTKTPRSWNWLSSCEFSWWLTGMTFKKNKYSRWKKTVLVINVVALSSQGDWGTLPFLKSWLKSGNKSCHWASTSCRFSCAAQSNLPNGKSYPERNRKLWEWLVFSGPSARSSFGANQITWFNRKIWEC